MIKKTITYEDYNGNTQTEDLYFHLSEAELIDMEAGSDTPGGLEQEVKEIIARNKPSEILAFFKKWVRDSYGVKSEDGKRFIKSEAQKLEFEQSAAYSEFYMSLVVDAAAAAEFVSGLIPKNLQSRLEQARADGTIPAAAIEGSVTTAELPDDRPAWIREDRDATRAEMDTMTQAQLTEAYMAKVKRSQNK